MENSKSPRLQLLLEDNHTQTNSDGGLDQLRELVLHRPPSSDDSLDQLRELVPGAAWANLKWSGQATPISTMLYLAINIIYKSIIVSRLSGNLLLAHCIPVEVAQHQHSTCLSARGVTQLPAGKRTGSVRRPTDARWPTRLPTRWEGPKTSMI